MGTLRLKILRASSSSIGLLIVWHVILTAVAPIVAHLVRVLLRSSVTLAALPVLLLVVLWGSLIIIPLILRISIRFLLLWLVLILIPDVLRIVPLVLVIISALLVVLAIALIHILILSLVVSIAHSHIVLTVGGSLARVVVGILILVIVHSVGISSSIGLLLAAVAILIVLGTVARILPSRIHIIAASSSSSTVMVVASI